MPQAPIIIDVEASGFGAGSYPIEVGFVLPNGEACCSLVQPARSWVHWDCDAQAVHGISRDLLFAHGRPALAVARMLNTRLRGCVAYSDAWGMDYTWLSKLFDEAGMVPAFRLEHLASIVPALSADHWNAMRTQIETQLGLKRHRASTDARVLQLTWLACCGPGPGSLAA